MNFTIPSLIKFARFTVMAFGIDFPLQHAKAFCEWFLKEVMFFDMNVPSPYLVEFTLYYENLISFVRGCGLYALGKIIVEGSDVCVGDAHPLLTREGLFELIKANKPPVKRDGVMQTPFGSPIE